MKCSRCDGTGKQEVLLGFGGDSEKIIDCYECDGTGEV